jgi:trans-2,3-dihydro-3-hydroxyanthranilate isomerase
VHHYLVVDVFTREPLSGNPVAVFPDTDDLPASLMQRIARELNLSETTFVQRPQHDGDARVRIFTPVNELPFAGHPLLGTALALAQHIPGDTLRLETAMGVIPFTLYRDHDGTALSARMQQPIPTWQPFDHTAELLHALGLDTSTLPVDVYHNGPRHVFVGLPDQAALSALTPNHHALAAFPDLATNCFTGQGTRWHTRMFSPAYGVTEDAATGSAAGPLLIHLLRHNALEPGHPIHITQGADIGRPSHMHASATGAPPDIHTVEVSGHGVITTHATLHL